MIENLVLSVNAVLPLFLIMGLGYLIRRTPMLNKQTHSAINMLVFKLFLPVLICKNIIDTDLTTISASGSYVYGAVSVLILFILMFILIPIIEKDNSRRGVLIQGISRSNYALFGLPLMANLYPNQDTAVASILLAIVIPIFNVMSVIALEVHRGGKVNLLKILKGIATNPLIISCVIGLIIMFLKIPIWTPIRSAINDVAKIATPLALFITGGSFEFSQVKHNMRPLTIGVLGKLVVAPLLGVTGAILCGFRGMDLAAIMIIFIAPTAVSSYPMAQQMGGDGELAGQQVVFSTAFSIVTVFLWVFLTKSLALI